MCQNKEVSFLLTLFSIAIIIKLCLEYKKTNEIKYLYISSYILLVGFIQFIEFFIHYYNDDKKNNIYQIASLCIVFGIVFQFIFSEIVVYKYGNMPLYLCIFDIIFYLCLLFFIPTLYGNFGKYKNDKTCNTILGCKLNWDCWNLIDKRNISISLIMKFIYLIYFCYATYLIFDITGLIIYIISFSLIYIPSFYYYYFLGKNLDGTGSAWCLLAILIFIFLIISGTLEKSHIIDS
jgi:hypothetical protein